MMGADSSSISTSSSYSFGDPKMGSAAPPRSLRLCCSGGCAPALSFSVSFFDNCAMSSPPLISARCLFQARSSSAKARNCFFFSNNSFPAYSMSFSSLTNSAKPCKSIPNTDLRRASIVSRFTLSISSYPSAGSEALALSRTDTPATSKHAPTPSATAPRLRTCAHFDPRDVAFDVSPSCKSPARSASDMNDDRSPRKLNTR